MSEILNILACCKIVKGYTRGAIYNLGRNQVHYVPLELCDILIRCEGLSKNEFLEAIVNQKFTEFIGLLYEEEIIQFVEEHEYKSFVNLKLEYDFPAHVSIVIIELNNELNFNLEKFVKVAERAGSEHFVFFLARFWNIRQLVDYWNHSKNLL